MIVAIGQIEQELAALQQGLVALAGESHWLYEQYLKALGLAVRQQLILACYHICTHTYPEKFLALSLVARQDLQQELQQLASQVEILIREQQKSLKLDAEQVDAPENLLEFHEQLDTGLVETLHQASKQVNQILQTAGLLPATPLDRVLEIAAKAEAAGRPVTRHPNLLTAMVDSLEDEDEPQEEAVIAVYLQLGEIEFNEPSLMSQRNALRQWASRVGKLQKQIAAKQREKLTAEAALAWRTTWHEGP